MIDRAAPLAEVLLLRAEQQPDAVAYEAVEPGGQVATMSYAQLAGRASALAEQLAADGDGPVLLLYPAGLDYVVAIFAGFLAGRPVIPAYPPRVGSGPDRTRLGGIIEDARPSAVVAKERYPEVPVPTLFAVPGADADGTAWRRPATGQDVAIVQYTSGSTGRPRGVLVRHDSVAANTAAIADRFGIDATSRGLTWLPPFHDMGLVGGLLTPLAAGIPVRILPPETFLKAPLTWLRQITETGATISGGPNFAYDLCVRRTRRDDELTGLDLSNWRVAFSGGETVRHRTMADFAARFAPVGFDPRAFLPCYGLAEATLIVSAGHWSGTSAATGSAVSCGTAVCGQRIVIVDPDRGVPCADGQEGEIWIAGPHVTPGYLSGESGELFGQLDGESYLRTGDRGYLRDGELFVTGRTKDVIVFRGVNYHAVDVETAALDAVGTVAGAAAAFLVEDGAQSLPVLVMEVRGKVDDQLASVVRAEVLARTQLPLAVVALVPPRSVPRTSSGKVQRSRCREAFLDGAYDEALTGDAAALAALTDVRARATATSELTTVICGIIAGVCEIPDCGPTDSLTEKGLDSVRAAEAAAVLEDALGLTVPLDAVLFAPTPRGVADALVQRWLAEDQEMTTVRDRIVMVAKGGETTAWI
ncbi:MAG TPA: AMP-binding protein [Micromonosporaceae bacterium]